MPEKEPPAGGRAFGGSEAEGMQRVPWPVALTRWGESEMLKAVGSVPRPRLTKRRDESSWRDSLRAPPWAGQSVRLRDWEELTPPPVVRKEGLVWCWAARRNGQGGREEGARY